MMNRKINQRLIHEAVNMDKLWSHHIYSFYFTLMQVIRAIMGNLNVIFLFCREINGEKKNFCLVTNPRKKLKYSMFSDTES